MKRFFAIIIISVIMIVIFFPSKFDLKIGSPSSQSEKEEFINSKDHSNFDNAIYKYKIEVVDKKNEDYFKKVFKIEGVAHELQLSGTDEALIRTFASNAKIYNYDSFLQIKKEKTIINEICLSNYTTKERIAYSEYDDSDEECIYNGFDFTKMSSYEYIVHITDLDIRNIEGVIYIDDDDCSIINKIDTTTYIYQFVYEDEDISAIRYIEETKDFKKEVTITFYDYQKFLADYFIYQLRYYNRDK